MTLTPKETDPQWLPRVWVANDGHHSEHPYFTPIEVGDEYLSCEESEHLLKKQAEKYEARIAELGKDCSDAFNLLNFIAKHQDPLFDFRSEAHEFLENIFLPKDRAIAGEGEK